MKGVTCLSKDDTTAVLRVTRQGKGYKRSLYDVLNCCSYALVILAYFQSSRGLEVASKSSVLSVACHKVQSWSLRKGLFCVVSHASAYNRNLCHVLKCCSYLNTVPQLKPKLNNAETKKPFHEFSFIKKSGSSFSENCKLLV